LKPSVVIAPGSFSSSALYKDLLDRLEAHGYEAIYVHLPSTRHRTDIPPPTMEDDAKHIQSVTTPLVEEGKDVVLVMHSYGGIPGTESARGLAKADRQASGKKGGISSLVYVTALLTRVGECLRDLNRGSDNMEQKVRAFV